MKLSRELIGKEHMVAHEGSKIADLPSQNATTTVGISFDDRLGVVQNVLIGIVFDWSLFVVFDWYSNLFWWRCVGFSVQGLGRVG